MYAVCPACLGCRVSDALVRFCGEHLSCLLFAGDYPLIECVPMDLAPLLEQGTLW